MSNPTPILNNINAFDATKGTTISFNIIGGTDIVRSNIAYIYDLSTNDLICTHLYISTESIHELPPNTDPSIVYADGKSSADFVNNKNYYLQIQTFTNTAGTAGGSGMSVAKTFWCLFNPALSVNTIPAAISTTSYNVGATYTTNITDVTIPVTNIIQQYKFDLYTATGTLVQTSGNIIGSGEQEGTSTTYNITYNFSGLVVNNSYYVVVTTTSTEGMTVSAQSNTFAVSIDTPTVGGAIVNNNACDGYISVVSNLSDEYGGHVSGEMASFETDSVNNVSSLKVNMEPIQDLHGYDHPWVAGAGKNKLNLDTNVTVLSGSVPSAVTITSEDGSATITENYYNRDANKFGWAFNVESNQTYAVSGNITSSGNTTIKIYAADGSVVYTYTLSNSQTTFSLSFDSSTNATLYFYATITSWGQTITLNNVQIEKGTATSWTPYSNICPISGHDEVETVVSGKNIFGGRAFADGIKTAIPQAVLDTDAKTISYASGYATSTSNFTSGVRFKENTRYTIILKFSNTVDRTNVLVAYTDGTSTIIRTSETGLQTIIFTSVANKTINYIGGSNNNGTSVFYYEECGVFEGVLTADQFEPYTEQTISQEFDVSLTTTSTDTDPYLFKAVGDIYGDRLEDKIVGGTVAWNQLASTLDSTHWEPATALTTNLQYSNGVVSFLATAQYAGITLSNEYRPESIKNHKYLFSVSAKAGSSAELQARSFGGYGDINFTASTSWTTATKIFNLPEDGLNPSNRAILLRDKRTSGWNTVEFKDVMLIDLTALFNPTIADYIYNLEQSQAGAGVAWFRQYFKKDYYPYDKGTLRSVEGVSAHETVGFNQWDEEWEVGSYNYSTGEKTVNVNTIRSKNLIPCLPNTNYYFRANLPINVFYVTYYDANKNFVSADISGIQNAVKATPSNARYMAFWVGNASNPQTYYNHDICINISDPSRNGEYEPYQKHTYPLDSSLTLRGVPKLVDGKLAFDGDVYPPSGEVQRRYGIVDLGTLTWSRNTTNQYFAPLPTAGTQYTANQICTKYLASERGAYDGNGDKVITVTGSNVWVRDTAYPSATGAEFKTAMSGVYLVYELATPTTETAEPFTNPQVVDNRGTEAYITTGIVPVGHNTTYLTRDIFGGTLDLVTGVLTVDKVMVDLGTLDWGYSLQYTRFFATVNDKKPYVSAGDYANLICSAYPFDGAAGLGGNMVDKTIVNRASASDNQVLVKDTTYTDVATFKSAMNGQQLVYELATPQTYQLTPHQIQTLVGQNNIWSDAGDVDVTFNLPISNLLVKRQDTSDTSGKWLTLYSQPITQASDMDFTYIDFLNQHGKTYRYALVPLLTQQQGGVDVEIEGGYTVSDDILSVFDGVFIANNNGSQKLKAATEYGDLETNQDVGVLTTIGNKYPFVVSNSNLNYHSGSISALIVPSDFYTSGDLDRLDIVERREAIEKFLTDKTAKILKDWNGNIWLITFVENVEVSFVDDYGMGLGTLSAKWVEIGDVNDQTDLKQTGLI